jgi:hypothetical protein
MLRHCCGNAVAMPTQHSTSQHITFLAFGNGYLRATYVPYPREDSMKYFVPKTAKLKKRAHIWFGRETACRLSSTGGLNPRRYMVVDSPGEREICQMCQNVFSRNRHRVASSDSTRVVWGESWDDVPQSSLAQGTLL